MVLKQLSLFIENKAGSITEPWAILSDAKINARAFTIADTTDFGIIRLIVDDPEKAELNLKNSGFTVNVTDVIALELNDVPGAFYNSLMKLNSAGINIEYSYAFAGPEIGKSTAIIKVKDIDKAVNALK